MRILITGGAGFIGSNLAAHARQEGHDVRILDDLSTGNRENIAALDVDFVEGSILDSRLVAECLEDRDAVVHLAAIPSVPRSIKAPLKSHEANATGTLNLLEEARKSQVKSVTVTSSSSVYGANASLPKREDDWVAPISPYGVSKLATEQYALSYQAAFGLKTTAFRFFNVFGPGQQAGHAYAAVVPTFINAILTGQPVPLHGDGSQSRDFTYVRTVCNILLSSAIQGRSHPRPINLAFGTRTTVRDLLARLEEIIGMPAIVERHEPRQGDVRHSQADNTLLLDTFPDVKPVDLDDGLRETVRWHLARLQPPLH